MSKFYNLAKFHTCKSDKKNYFEGWYVKIEEYDSSLIKIEDNIFTEDNIILNLYRKRLKKLSGDDVCYFSTVANANYFDRSDIYLNNIRISAKIELKEVKLIDKPIMGIFKFISGYIGCNHGLIALRMTANIDI
ncbi:28918_t:CDS:2 [Gigaspora margarita]|uniref:28918_t:CDS:1 n=1 Tax=Gigaspora margarita TaxID=4874 RepID=A0ABM8W095_GIGMA|nr:28918_t:CDS:2 [Gigaspora margarita]